MAKRRPTKPTWEFLWGRDHEWPRTMHSRVYIAMTIEKACDKMLRWIESQHYWIVVDQEARAEHLSFQVNHALKYPNLSALDHRIREYV